MSKLELLSIAEDSHKCNCMSARQSVYYKGVSQTLYLSINTERELTITINPLAPLTRDTTRFKGIDIDGLIEYLQDVRTFLSEEDMIKKLIEGNQ